MVILQKVEECQNRNDYPHSIKRSRDDDTTMVILHRINGVRQSQSPPTNQRLCEVTRLVQKKRRAKKNGEKIMKIKKDEKKMAKENKDDEIAKQEQSRVTMNQK